jgi:hypothetical protein
VFLRVLWAHGNLWQNAQVRDVVHPFDQGQPFAKKQFCDRGILVPEAVAIHKIELHGLADRRPDQPTVGGPQDRLTCVLLLAAL